MSNYKNCPNCENIGFSVYPDFVTGEPEQEQCQFCYEEPNSVFNVITKLEAENQALRNELEALKDSAPSIESGKNRYGLDVSYFRNLFNRELNRSLRDFRPDELARVLARASRTADKDVMLEKEFIDINKIKADAICDLADNYVNGPITAELTVEYIYEYANKLEQDND